jgi:hypothetical protein
MDCPKNSIYLIPSLGYHVPPGEQAKTSDQSVSFPAARPRVSETFLTYSLSIYTFEQVGYFSSQTRRYVPDVTASDGCESEEIDPMTYSDQSQSIWEEISCSSNLQFLVTVSSRPCESSHGTFVSRGRDLLSLRLG